MKTVIRAALLPAGLAAALAGGLVASPALADQPLHTERLQRAQLGQRVAAQQYPDEGGHRLRAITLTNQAM